MRPISLPNWKKVLVNAFVTNASNFTMQTCLNSNSSVLTDNDVSALVLLNFWAPCWFRVKYLFTCWVLCIGSDHSVCNFNTVYTGMLSGLVAPEASNVLAEVPKVPFLFLWCGYRKSLHSRAFKAIIFFILLPVLVNELCYSSAHKIWTMPLVTCAFVSFFVQTVLRNS
jgi:hypothetical protein